MPTRRDAAGPTTHYELFAGLRDAGVAYLLTGAIALTLYGVPRLTAEIAMAADPDRANLERLWLLLAAWGYGAAAPATAGAVIRRYRHPSAALDAIDIILPAAEEFARLQAGAAVVTLVDVGLSLVGAGDLRALKAASGARTDQDDADGLEVLCSIQAGETGSERDTQREQIRKFSRWPVSARLDWLLAAARLAKGLSPEAKRMTRGLTRRHGWPGRRDGH